MASLQTLPRGKGLPAHTLLPKSLCKVIPKSQGDDLIVYAKFFTPDSNWTWYVTEAVAYVPVGDDYKEVALADLGDTPFEDIHFFGLVEGFEAELGKFSYNELVQARGPMGLQVERDLYWAPKRLKEVRKT